MSQASEPTPVHCYTNPSFCRQSEYIPDDHHVNDLPPPPPLQFQGGDDLPPPPPPLQLQLHAAGQSNPAFQSPPETTLDNVGGSRDRYCYLEDNGAPSAHRRYASLPVDEPRVTYIQSSRYEYTQEQNERDRLPRRASSRYEFIPQQQVQQRSAPAANQDDRGGSQTRTCRGNAGRYAVIPGDQDYQDYQDGPQWSNAKSAPRHINTPQGDFSFILIVVKNKIILFFSSTF